MKAITAMTMTSVMQQDALPQDPDGVLLARRRDTGSWRGVIISSAVDPVDLLVIVELVIRNPGTL